MALVFRIKKNILIDSSIFIYHLYEYGSENIDNINLCMYVYTHVL
jgi:hypothetical protein